MRFFGDLKRALEAAVEKGEIEPRREADYYIDWAEARGLVPRS